LKQQMGGEKKRAKKKHGLGWEVNCSKSQSPSKLELRQKKGGAKDRQDFKSGEGIPAKRGGKKKREITTRNATERTMNGQDLVTKKTERRLPVKHGEKRGGQGGGRLRNQAM